MRKYAKRSKAKKYRKIKIKKAQFWGLKTWGGGGGAQAPGPPPLDQLVSIHCSI